MADVVSPEVRSRMMSGIRGKNTKPEILIRRGLHALGFRFRLHRRSLLGKPDLILPKYHAAIFVHGCFWHGHSCSLFKWPKSRTSFWKEKIGRNQHRDEFVMQTLKLEGWRYAIIWECAIKGRGRHSEEIVLKKCAAWLKSNRPTLEIRGKL